MTHHSPRYSVSILPHGDKYYRFGRSFSGTHTLGVSRLLPYWNMLGRMSTQSLPAEDQGGLQQTVADNVRRRAGYLDFSRSDVARHLGVTGPRILCQAFPPHDKPRAPPLPAGPLLVEALLDVAELDVMHA